MKNVLAKALCLLLSVGLVLSLTACFGGGPDSSDPVSNPDSSVGGTLSGDASDGNTDDGGSADGDNDHVAGDGGNSVDGGLLFADPDDDTTTTTNKTDDPTTTQNAGGQNGTTTTTAEQDEPTPPATTTTTTKKPVTTTTVTPPQQEEIENVKLPAAGYDPDGKGRIVVDKSEVKTVDKKQVAYITFVNQSDKTGKKWIIPEYSKVTFACYDKKGNEVKGEGDSFGTLFLGSLEVGEKVTCQFEIPKGTVEVKITGHNFEYWTPWS